MAYLKMSPGRKIKVAATFEIPDDDKIVMAMDPVARAEMMASSMGELSDDVIDEAMGLMPMPIAQISLITKHAIGRDDTVFLDRDELRKHIYECLAVFKSMDDFASSVNKTMAEYRDKVVKGAQANDQD